MGKPIVLLFYGFIISFFISCQSWDDSHFPREIPNQEIPNWEYIARNLYNSLGDEYIRDH